MYTLSTVETRWHLVTRSLIHYILLTTDYLLVIRKIYAMQKFAACYVKTMTPMKQPIKLHVATLQLLPPLQLLHV
jgi:hypothetical protein